MFWYYTTITPHTIHHSHFRTHLCFFKYSIFFEHQRQIRKLFISANAHTALSALVLVNLRTERTSQPKRDTRRRFG